MVKLVWNFSAFLSTIILILIGLAIYDKAKKKKDSPIYRLINRFKRKEEDNNISDNELHYKRIYHRGGFKW